MNTVERLISDLNVEDWVIRLRPNYQADGTTWTGGIEIAVIGPFEESPMPEEDMDKMIDFIDMMLACTSLMRESEELRNAAGQVVDFLNQEQDELDILVQLEEEEKAGVKKTYDGNVISLTFNSNTKGNA